MNKILVKSLALLPFLCGNLLFAKTTKTLRARKDYAKSYAIVTSEAVMNDKEWKEVVEALKRKHNADVVIYNDKLSITLSLPDLQAIFPKYVCFVMKPEEAKFIDVVSVHRMMRNLDDDIYTDAIYSFLTGPTAKDAKRIALATEPNLANKALISSAIGTERYEQAYVLSDAKSGLIGIKNKQDSTAKMQDMPGDLTQFFIKGWNEMDPDIVLTSAHASQRNLEMPFGKGNIVCRDGKLYGLPKARMINYSTGQATTNADGASGLLPMNEPTKPKVVFCVGNCLIGDIPDNNSMALAFMGYGKANQYIGYSTTTWFGMAGWTTLKLWEQNAGVMPLNQAYYFSNQNLLYNLYKIAPDAKGFNPVYSVASQYDKEFKVALRNFKLKAEAKYRQQIIGMLWDRDATVMYGDPAFECKINQENLSPEFLPTRTLALKVCENNVYKLIIKANAKIAAANKDTAPSVLYLPHRIKNVKIKDSLGMNIVITDNFIMIPDLKAMEKDEEIEIIFKATKI